MSEQLVKDEQTIDPSQGLAIDVNEVIEYYKDLAAERSKENADQQFLITKLLAERKELMARVDRLMAEVQKGGGKVELNGSHEDRRPDPAEGGS